MKTVFLCLMMLLGMLLSTYTSFVKDVRNHVLGTSTEYTSKISTNELSYRDCLRREAGMVGVASLKQMQKCEKETGYGK